MDNSHLSSFSLILAEGYFSTSGWPFQGQWDPWSIWVWPEDSHTSCPLYSRERHFQRASSWLKI